VTLPRENWTDKRLDDLNEKVDDGFARTDKKMDEGFARVDKDIRELRGEIKEVKGEMNSRFDSLNRTLIGAAVAIVVALVGSNATLIGLALL